jgi:hypothetical protein
VAVEPGALRGRGIQPESPRLSLFDRRQPHGGTVPDRSDTRGHRASDSSQGSRDSVQRTANRRGYGQSAGPQGRIERSRARCGSGVSPHG